jgi:succinate dehydrogenase / fumarate reductase, cytochrome b subunit
MHALIRFYHTTVGKKLVMAVTGIILSLYVLMHMLGNMQIYLGSSQLNRYAQLLHSNMALLWCVRAVMLVAVAWHVLIATQLTLRNWGARPVGYIIQRFREADYASRMMIWGGIVLTGFVVYHILHLTVGSVGPSLIPLDVYHNVISGFSVWYVVAVYAVAQIALGLHLYHGLWSLFQTIGLSHPLYNRWRRCLAMVCAVVVVTGNLSIAVAVLSGHLV